MYVWMPAIAWLHAALKFKMPTSPMVAKIVYRIVPTGSILAEELFIPSSVINSVHEFTYFFAEVISDILSHGIEPPQ